MKTNREETYIGDGVYASFDGYQIWLRTERGNITHYIALDPNTFQSLIEYEETLNENNN